MGLTDELEALRQSGSVKSKSAGLSAAAATTSSTAFITPEAEAERRRNKALQEKQSRLEAKIALHSNNYGGEDDLNSILLNKKLIEEQRSKKKEAERNLREWRRKHHDGVGGVEGKTKGTAAIASVRSEAGDDDDEEDDHEARMNRDALEMLPEHVVRTLKAKYETNNAELALERALQEEEMKHGHGKGMALAKLMEITLEEDDDDDEEEGGGGGGGGDDDEENGGDEEEGETEDPQQQQQQPPATDAADEEWVKIEQKVNVEAKGGVELKEQLVAEEEVEEDDKNGVMGNKVAVAVGVAAAVAAAAVAVVAATSTTTASITNDEPEPVEVQVEEVREKIEHLSIDEEAGGDEKEDASVIINVDNDSGADTTNRDIIIDEDTKEHSPSNEDDNNSALPSKNYDRQIEQTKRFYNLHSQEYIEHTSIKKNITATTMTTTTTTMDSKNLSSSSSSRRDAFITHILMQQQQITNSTNNDPTITNSTTSPSLLLLDLGCGYGRDTYHFTTTLGHRVLGIDYSIEMLHHARRLAPLAHYLNMDMRHLKNALVHESLDGIWANSSLLHLPKVDMFDVLQGLYGAMKVGGVLFMSLKVRDAESTVDDEEVFDVDERYVARNSLPPPASVDADAVTAGENVEVSNDDDDTRRKFYSYYTLEEVRELVVKSRWTILEINEEDHRGVSDYVDHTKVYVFATRSNE